MEASGRKVIFVPVFPQVPMISISEVGRRCCRSGGVSCRRGALPPRTVWRGVHARHAHAVQSAGYLIAPAAELSSGMKDREYYFNSRKTRFMVDSDRDTPSVVNDRN